jgi:hypothetical protein
MLARLGDVIYWAGAGIAWLFVAYGLWAYVFHHNTDRLFWLIVSGVWAIVTYLIARACRYVLAGR